MTHLNSEGIIFTESFPGNIYLLIKTIETLEKDVKYLQN